MADRVFLHLGAPKTGTTYLQSVLHQRRRELEAAGVRYAEGRFRNDRVWASEVLRDFSLRTRPPHAAGAWDRILDQVRGWDGAAVISHEFLGACTAAQAARAHGDLAPAELHLVLTARDYVSQAAAVWQERLKYGHAEPLRAFDLDNDTPAWSWATQDLPRILERWRHDLPVEQVHVVTVPRPGSAPDELWHRFSSVLGLARGQVEPAVVTGNTSLGLVEAELLRRVSGRVRDLGLLPRPQDRTRLLRDVLANAVLSRGSRERFSAPVEQAQALAERAAADVAQLRSAGYHVVGSLEDLVPDPAATGGRIPDDATDAEVAEAAVEALARLLVELRSARARHQGTTGDAPAPSRLRRWWAAVGSRAS